MQVQLILPYSSVPAYCLCNCIFIHICM
jgi:hypothetical protein